MWSIGGAAPLLVGTKIAIVRPRLYRWGSRVSLLTQLVGSPFASSAHAQGYDIPLDNNDFLANNTAVNGMVGSHFVSDDDNKFSGNTSDRAAPSSFKSIH